MWSLFFIFYKFYVEFTKAEEVECETLALRATSNLINANIDGMSDFEIHGRNVSEYASMEDIEAVSGVDDGTVIVKCDSKILNASILEQLLNLKSFFEI